MLKYFRQMLVVIFGSIVLVGATSCGTRCYFEEEDMTNPAVQGLLQILYDNFEMHDVFENFVNPNFQKELAQNKYEWYLENWKDALAWIIDHTQRARNEFEHINAIHDSPCECYDLMLVKHDAEIRPTNDKCWLVSVRVAIRCVECNRNWGNSENISSPGHGWIYSDCGSTAICFRCLIVKTNN